jgi:L-2,4-diaminobutyric acid acetyltransferase
LIDSGLAGLNPAPQPTSSSGSIDPETTFRSPVAEDAHAISALIASCPPLDANSLYCNLLQCTHFAATCIIAEREGKLEGWISAYRPPNDHQAIFVWQVAVHAGARGRGLGVAMLEALLARPAVADATRLITTVTPSNLASRRMFDSFARLHHAAVTARPHFDRERHFGGGHESEELIAIGPLTPRN